MAKSVQRPITLAIAAMGGQGGGVLTDWLIEAAEKSGLLVQATSVPGVAQRTGSTVYYLEFFPEPEGGQSGKKPVMALMPTPGDVDIVVAGELMEAGRSILKGFVAADKTTLIASTHRDYALSEKMAMGDGRTDSEAILQSAKTTSRQFIGFDMAALAEDCGSVISSVLLGAISGTDILPVSRETFEQTIRDSGKGVKASLAGFAAGYDQTRKILEGTPATGPTGTATIPLPRPSGDLPPEIRALIARINGFPQPLHETLLQATRKLVDYQDCDYAAEYLDTVKKMIPVDEAHATAGNHYTLSREFARHLALWMSIEDGIRVADLKIRPGRFRRVREEIRAGPDQIVRITEFMHPRVEEICDVLPPRLAAAILGSGSLRKLLGLLCNRPRRIQTTSLSGFFFLYLVAGLKRWRRRTYRHVREQAAIKAWFEEIVRSAEVDYRLAVQVVQCQRLIKGYGETYERGARNFQAIMSRLDQISRQPDPAGLVESLRNAALADETGSSLQTALEKVA